MPVYFNAHNRQIYMSIFVYNKNMERRTTQIRNRPTCSTRQGGKKEVRQCTPFFARRASGTQTGNRSRPSEKPSRA